MVLWFGPGAVASRAMNQGLLHFTTADGLLANNIMSSFPAPDGSIWFCTDFGANPRGFALRWNSFVNSRCRWAGRDAFFRFKLVMDDVVMRRGRLICRYDGKFTTLTMVTIRTTT
jgi:hypothetical protein